MKHGIFKKTGLALWIAVGISSGTTQANADDFVIYSVYKGLDFGNPGEHPQKDFYVNMGTGQGLTRGSTLEVFRRTPTYDLSTQKLYRDAMFPIARIKIIHAEDGLAIARLDHMLPADQTPVITPGAIMVGDVVRKP